MIPIRALAAAAALLLAAVFAAPASAAPLEAYGKLPSIEDVAISPSGHAVAAVVTNGEERIIVVKKIGADDILMRASTGTVKVRNVQWAGDGHLIIVTSVTGRAIGVMASRREWLTAFSFDLATKRVRPLMRDADGAMNTIFDLPVVRMVKGEPTVFIQGVYFVGGMGRLSLFRIDLGRSASDLIQTGMEDTRDWVLDAEGRPVAQELYDDRSGRWTLKVRAGGGWRDVQTAVAPVDRPYVLGLGRDGKSVMFATHDGKRPVWQEASLETGSLGQAIPLDTNQSPIRDPQDGRLIGHYALVGDQGRYTFFDANDAKVWKAVQAAYPNASVSLESWSADRRKIAVLVDSPTEGPAYAIVDLDTRKANWLGDQYMGLEPQDIAPKSTLSFKARDGLALTGYLTTPPAREGKNLPLVVFPHGGPAARDEPGFDWWAQAMASRGYAVLQVNFRGSEGLGDALLEAGYGEFGRKMQTDLSDGVKHLADKGVIDPKRVCIVGASYGGYAALAGATHDRGVYRCAASVAGVADLKKQIAFSRSRGGEATLRYWTRFVGAEDLGDPVLTELSPAAHAAKAEIPILLVHGRDDTVVGIEQSRIMAEALRKAGKSVELVEQPGEDHWLTRGATRSAMLTSVVTFLEKHNPPN